MYYVKGHTRESIRTELQKLKELNNRAFRDLNEGCMLLERDLIYPFIHGFSDDVKTILRKELVAAQRDSHPFEYLYQYAPTDVPDASLHVLSPPEPQFQDSDVHVVLSALRQVFKGNFAQKNSNMTSRNSPCSRCGRRHPMGQCPATGKTCSFCQKLGHFAHISSIPITAFNCSEGLFEFRVALLPLVTTQNVDKSYLHPPIYPLYKKGQ